MLFLVAFVSAFVPLGSLIVDAGGYKFILDNERWVAMQFGQTHSIGKLDRFGNFVPDRRWVSVRGATSGNPPYTLINAGPRPAYEFRSGRLILGELTESGNFVPKTGSKVVLLEDYRPGEDVLPIYNLPGRFEKSQVQRSFPAPAPGDEP